MRVIPKVPAHRKRRKYVKAAKGFFGGRHRLYRTAREVVERAWQFQYEHRRLRKRDFRRLWIVRINAAARQNGTTYSRLMNALKKANIQINRKMLATLAVEDPAAFSKIVKTALENA
ncbi:MAG TPA: 50S ribosomal protein L20 [candidate division Zixibacteria bacterium]|nr:50S ribosomal protein L20 [candidate division Zixibacteria bacterium]